MRLEKDTRRPSAKTSSIFFSSHKNRNLDHEDSVGADVNVLDGLRLKKLPQKDANTSKLDYSSIMNQSGLSEK